jgi:hypothetical protein
VTRWHAMDDLGRKYSVGVRRVEDAYEPTQSQPILGDTEWLANFYNGVRVEMSSIIQKARSRTTLDSFFTFQTNMEFRLVERRHNPPQLPKQGQLTFGTYDRGGQLLRTVRLGGPTSPHIIDWTQEQANAFNDWVKELFENDRGIL